MQADWHIHFDGPCVFTASLAANADADGTVEEQHSAVNSAKAAKKARQKAAAAAAATAATGVDSQDSSADANGTATSTEVAAPGSGDDALTATPAEGVDPAEVSFSRHPLFVFSVACCKHS